MSPLIGTRGSGSAIAYGARGLAKAAFIAGDKAVADLYTLSLSMVNGVAAPVAPTSGGTLTVNGNSMGSYDYTLKFGHTLSSFTASDWFTSNQDTRSAFIAIDGNLTINSGVVLAPQVRKLFTVLHVKGDLIVNGEISMTGKGAMHIGSINATEIRIKNGTYSGVSNPSVPASGGSGGLGGTDPDGSWGAAGKGNTGGAGSNGGTGGGGGGALYLPWYVGSASRGGDGSGGTSFSGGSGGGSLYDATDGNQNASGHRGGNSWNYFAASPGPAGGTGNPSGDNKYGSNGTVGRTGQYDGTGGVLIIFVEGTYSGSGTVTANGVGYGAGSGGGSLTLIAKTDNGPVPTATGGITGYGDGGAGTARKLILV